MTLNEAAAFLNARNDFLILTHKRPDGDTVGSGAALCRLLRGLGKEAWLHPNEDLSPKYAFLSQGLLAPASFTPRPWRRWMWPPKSCCLPAPSPMRAPSICASTTTVPTPALPGRPWWTPAVPLWAN